MLVYAAWLVALGHEAAKWYGAIMAVLIGTAYPFVIAISLSVRSIKPFAMREPASERNRTVDPTADGTSFVHCSDCGGDGAEIAICCGKPVCPSHRIGTGTISDGFWCNDHPFGV